MMLVDSDWFHARGGLHDARVLFVIERDGDLLIGVNDEWANEHDGEKHRVPGSITFQHAALLAGSIAGLEGGWVSEFSLTEAGVFDLAFCDRERTAITATKAFWTAH